MGSWTERLDATDNTSGSTTSATVSVRRHRPSSAAASFDHEQNGDANSSTCRAGPGACLGRRIANAENCSKQIAGVPLSSLPSTLPAVGTQAAIGDRVAAHPTGAPSYAAIGPERISIAGIGTRVPHTAGSSIYTSDESRSVASERARERETETK